MDTSIELRGQKIVVPYTICFVKCGNDILVVKRNKPPHQEKFNGLGGKIKESDLSIRKSVQREVCEETDGEIMLPDEGLVYTGVVSWKYYSKDKNIKTGGMYAYVAEIARKPFRRKISKEGVLLWKKSTFLNDPNQINTVADSIHAFLPHLLKVFVGTQAPREYLCDYTLGRGFFVPVTHFHAIA
jgi:8-oxo-dGTP diphosphatase